MDSISKDFYKQFKDNQAEPEANIKHLFKLAGSLVHTAQLTPVQALNILETTEERLQQSLALIKQPLASLPKNKVFNTNEQNHPFLFNGNENI
ncbi:hypothetical protein AUJ17_05905 [Candidatus Micrarchaeota archaeon CG1_02_47_40]|nr:MAG: hypothetical protein AUJ17_05905 [Candidatus Micrarchaeota archaeon CG1_02_47_40]